MKSDAEILGAKRHIVAANGLDFELFEAGEGDRLALLLHGFPQNALGWRRVVPWFLAKGYRVWIVNQRGYGATTRPKGRDAYKLTPLLEDIAGLIDAAGAARSILVGHDWGGLLAFAFAARRLRPLEKLVVFNAPHPRCFANALKQPDQKRRSSYIPVFQLPLLPELLLGAGHAALVGRAMHRGARAVDEEVVERYRAQASAPGALTAMLNWYRAAFPEIISAPDLATPFDTPTLMIWGDRDFALTPACLDGTETFVHDLTLHRLPRASHWGPEENAVEAEEFLKSFL